MSDKTNYFENKCIDLLWRGQSLSVGSATLSWSAPPTFYLGLFTVAPAESGGGTELSGGSYARQALTASLASMSGTQSSGSTTASTGTSGTTSNNNAIVWANLPACSLVALGIFDAAVSGNLLAWKALTGQPVSVSSGQSFTIPAANLTIQDDN